MLKKKGKSESQASITYRWNRRNNNIAFFICIIITIIAFVIGIYFIDSSLYNFICSCAVGVTCGYITGWISNYFADKQTASLLELDYRISKIDEFIRDCDFEINIFPYNSVEHPQKVNMYNLQVDSKFYFACLNRMGAVFKEISDSDIGDFHNIEVDFYTDDIKYKKVKLGDFEKQISSYCEEQYSKYSKINLSMIQCNNMFINAMSVKYELGKVKDKLILEKENIIFKKRNK